MSVYIIAEAGVNHNGSEEYAYELIDIAIEAGADAVKFQTFKTKNLVSKKAVKANYQAKITDSKETQYQMLKNLELSDGVFINLSKYCKKNNIDFMSTAFDHRSLEFINKLGVSRLKIPSGDLTDAPLLLAHARTGKDLIVSTGMASIPDIEEALAIISYGFLNKNLRNINKNKIYNAYKSRLAKSLLKEKVILLHCTSDYPASFKDINLRAMNHMEEKFQLQVGYSDHSLGIVVPIAAVSRGAQVIEKHFTIDRNMKGPDHKASLEPDDLKKMIESIRISETILGKKKKEPAKSEESNKAAIRKSIIAARDIKKGEIYTPNNIIIQRPGGGISPIRYWDLLNSPASQPLKKGDYISE